MKDWMARPASPEVTLAAETKAVEVEVKEGESPETNLLPPEGWEDDTSTVDSGYSENFTGNPYPVIVEGTNTPMETSLQDTLIQTYTHWMEQPWFWPVFAVVVAWTVVWKALALWHAARNGQRNWFIALLVVNTVGLLEIAYLKWGQRKVK